MHSHAGPLTLHPAEAYASERIAGALDGAARGDARLEAHVLGPPAIVLGSGQDESTLDRAAAAADGYTIVRRGTGGGAVLCDDGLLIVELAVAANQAGAVDDVTDSYRIVGGAIRSALTVTGLDCALVSVADARGQTADAAAAARLACFAGISPYEIVTPSGGKLVGLAQRRRGGAVLFEIAFPCTGSQERLLTYLRPRPEIADTLAASPLLRAELGALDPALAHPGAVWTLVEPTLRALI